MDRKTKQLSNIMNLIEKEITGGGYVKMDDVAIIVRILTKAIHDNQVSSVEEIDGLKAKLAEVNALVEEKNKETEANLSGIREDVSAVEETLIGVDGSLSGVIEETKSSIDSTLRDKVQALTDEISKMKIQIGSDITSSKTSLFEAIRASIESEVNALEDQIGSISERLAFVESKETKTDTPFELRDKLESIKDEDEKLSPTAIKGGDKFVDQSTLERGLSIVDQRTSFLINKVSNLAAQGTGSGGSSTFIGLTDTPASYSGQANKTVTVKADASGLEFTTPAGGGDALTANPLSQFAATTSAQLASVISDETGTDKVVFNTSPTLVTPVLGVATATSVNKVAITAPATSATLTIADGATLTVNGSATITNGTHSGTNTGDQTSVTGNAGTVTVADAGGDTTTFPLLGTAATGSLSPATDAELTYNATTNVLSTAGLNLSGLTASEIVITDASKNLASAAVATYPSLTELTYVKGVTSAIQTQLNAKQGTLTNSAGLAAALSDETGTGLAVFNNSPTFVDDITVGTAGTATGSILMKGTTSGTVTLKTADAAGTYTLTLPTDDGDANQVLKTDGSGVLSWTTPAGSGDVSKVGTPVNNQVGVWTGDGTLEGDTALTFDTATDTLTTGIVNSTSLTASEIVLTDASKNLVSAAVATYPSLTELTYVKGVTSALQTQLNAKQATLTNSAGLASALSDETGTGLVVFNNSPTFVDDITVGTAGTATGSILMKGTTSGTVTIKTADAAGTYTLTLPTDDGDADQVLKTDGSGVLSWTTPAGGGDVSKVGTPVNNQVGVWTGDGTLEGDAALTFDTTTDVLSSGGFLGTGLTASEIVITDGSKNLVSAAVATYPSLTELTYVKGVTSAIQTQIAAKVTGPASATDNAVVRFDSTTGKLVQDSAVTIADTTGDITGGKYNKVTITAPASGSTITVADGKVFTASNTITLTGTDSVSMNVTNNKLRVISFGKDNNGSALSTGQIGFVAVPSYAGTIAGYNISVDTGTATVRFWKVATGTAIPTSGNSINTSGVAISTGTHVHSTTTSDFTTTTITAFDIIACELTAVASATKIHVELEVIAS